MKVGDYVRTRKGYIAKYKGIGKCNNIDSESEDWFIFDSTIIDDYGDRVPVEINKSYFIKSSPNIIDLIEVGDLVRIEVEKDSTNVFEVCAINYNNNEIGVFNNNFEFDWASMEQVKSIVTEEQFESMEYKIQ